MKAAKRFALVLPALWSAMPVVAQDPAPPPTASKYFAVELVRGKLAEEHAKRITSDAIIAADVAGAAVEKLLQAKFTKRPRLVVYADPEVYRKIEKTESKETVVVDEFCANDGSSVHVLLRPLLGRELGMRIGLPEPTRQAVMRCAAQVLTAAHLPVAAADPWLATVVAFGVLESLTNPGGACGVDPHFDDRRVWHTVTIRGTGDVELRQRLAETAPPKDPDEYRISMGRAALTAQLLAKDGPGWARRLLTKPAKDLGVATNRQRAFESVLGRDWSKIEAKWVALRQSMQASWMPTNEVRAGKKGIQLAGDGITAVLCSTTSMPAGPSAVRGTLTMTGESSEFRVELDWDGQSLLAVWFQKGECTINEFLGKGGWQPPQKVASAPIPIGKPFDFRVIVDDAVSVSIDGVEVASVPRGARTMTGIWQVAANETITVVEGLRIESLPASKK